MFTPQQPPREPFLRPRVHLYIYVYTCIILHQKERRECSSIVSSSVVVLLTPLYLSFSLRFSYCHSTRLSSSPSSSRLLHSFSFLLHFNSVCLSLSLFLFLKPFTSLNDFDPFGYGQFFFSPKPQVSKHAGRVLAGREGRINNLTDAGVEEYPIQWSRLGPLLSLSLFFSPSSFDSRDCIGRETNPLNYPSRVLIARSSSSDHLCRFPSRSWLVRKRTTLACTFASRVNWNLQELKTESISLDLFSSPVSFTCSGDRVDSIQRPEPIEGRVRIELKARILAAVVVRHAPDRSWIVNDIDDPARSCGT